jgi:hypothetical protein
MQIRVPERYFSREEAEVWLAKLRRELSQIKTWLLAGAGVAVVRVLSRQQAGLLRLQVDLIHFAEGLLQDEDPLTVVREVGALAEEGQPSEVRRQVAVGRRRGPVVGR